MVVDVIALGKAFGGRLLSSVGALLKGGLAKRSARDRAIRGEDLSEASEVLMREVPRRNLSVA